MNNLTFGNERHQYYETICSGAPAGPGFNGASGRAHPHDQFAPHRPRSAGKPLPGRARGFPHPARLAAARGRWNAGDGTLRRIRFRERMDLALLDRASARAEFRDRRRRGRRTRAQQREARRRPRGTLPGCAQTALEAGEAMEIIRRPAAVGGSAADAASPLAGGGARPYAASANRTAVPAVVTRRQLTHFDRRNRGIPRS